MAKADSDLVSCYETTYITRIDATPTALKNLADRLEKIVQTHEGKVLHNEDWGKRKLSYTIKKESRGQYTYFSYTGKGNPVAEIERNLRINESVLRFASVRLLDEFDQETYDKIHWSPIKNAVPEREEEYGHGKR